MKWFIYYPVLITYGCLGLVTLIAKIIDFRTARKKRRLPFTEKFLRAPGHSLSSEIRKTGEEIQIYSALLFIMPLFFYVPILFYFSSTGPTDKHMGMLFIFLTVSFLGYCLWKLWKNLILRRTYRLGLEGELAMGQELNALMRNGFHVYHDFPAKNFNIDHVVVGPTGVFAVETKARKKPIGRDDPGNWQVSYDGKLLRFPGWNESKPLYQARNQAKWLSQCLTHAVGDNVPVTPVLAFPGWFVKRKVGRDGLYVINAKKEMFNSVFKIPAAKNLNPKTISQIAHQVELRCRDVEPRVL